MTEFIPTAWVRTNCPFSFKFRLFVAEAGLQDFIRFVEMDPDSEKFAPAKAEVAKRFGREPVFPIVEFSPGDFMTDSDKLIDYFAKINAVDLTKLPTLTFYKQGLFICYLEMFAILVRPLGWIARLGRKPKAFR